MEQLVSQLNIDFDIPSACQSDRICFFDIETTGLSADISSLYLIGAISFRQNKPVLTQWFADDYTSEKEILTSFSEYLKPFTTLIHYNGSTFDIPYLEKKYRQHGLSSPFTSLESMDIYKYVKKKKHLFPVSNMKLTTMEHLLGFRRNDTYSGKDCIQLYTDYMHKKFFRDDVSETLKNCLLLHNHDDLIGTMLCSHLLRYNLYKPIAPTHTREADTLTLCDTHPIPVAYDCMVDDITIHHTTEEVRLQIPLFTGTLYHFYSDYKNYFYLPEEDTAIHKSVGIYVDKDHREKATAKNCYVKKAGTFLPIPQNMVTDTMTIFSETKKGRPYLLLEDNSPLLTADFIAGYIRQILEC